MYLPEHVILTALRKRYPLPEWCFAAKIPDAAGFAKSRTADAMAVNTWPSRGMETHGFECKGSRSDTLKELRSPDKAESSIRWCNRWWLVVTDPSFVKDGELPPTWGLMLVQRKDAEKPATLRVLVDAPQLRRIEAPSWEFLAVLMRKALEQNGVDEEERRSIERVARANERELVEKAAERRVQRANDDLQSLKESMAKFEEASGVRIDRWDAGRIGEAIKLVLTGGVQEKFDTCERLAQTAEGIAAEVRARVDQLRRAQAEENAKARALAEGKDINHYLPAAQQNVNGWIRAWPA